MPIVGPGETANDRYIEQLVASAEAAVDKAVDLGIADRSRIAVGGHSYGAFMTANLLAHTDLFVAGIARSGAYNRSLTPFGFQAETRTFWEVPEVYAKMSPFWNANKIKEPVLLIHGEADDNTGTFPIQSERFYMALKGHGATARYVTLPHEAHGYAARESNMHVVAETLNWLEYYVKSLEIAVAHVDVRFGDALEHARRGAGLVADRHQGHLLLLHDTEPGRVEACARARLILGEHVHESVDFDVAVDVDAGGADAADRLRQHAGPIVGKRDREIRVEMRRHKDLLLLLQFLLSEFFQLLELEVVRAVELVDLAVAERPSARG
jgi:dienelactone hydrolase